jgi:hypothetical protein
MLVRVSVLLHLLDHIPKLKKRARQYGVRQELVENYEVTNE